MRAPPHYEEKKYAWSRPDAGGKRGASICLRKGGPRYCWQVFSGQTPEQTLERGESVLSLERGGSHRSEERIDEIGLGGYKQKTRGKIENLCAVGSDRRAIERGGRADFV